MHTIERFWITLFGYEGAVVFENLATTFLGILIGIIIGVYITCWLLHNKIRYDYDMPLDGKLRVAHGKRKWLVGNPRTVWEEIEHVWVALWGSVIDIKIPYEEKDRKNMIMVGIILVSIIVISFLLALIMAIHITVDPESLLKTK